MNFDAFAACYALLWAAASAALYALGARLRRRLLRPANGDAAAAQRNEAFTACRRRFLLAYCPILLADGLQGPYLYYVFMSVGLVPTQIAGLFVLGYLASAAAAIGVLHIGDRVERRLLCLAYCAVSATGCLLKLADSFHVLAIGRLFDGAAAALLSVPFNQWYTGEHCGRYDFPKEWLGSTLRRVAVLGGFCAAAAGAVAQAAVAITGLPPAPHLMAVPALVLGGALMHCTWQPNRRDTATDSTEFHGALSRLARTTAALSADAGAALLFGIQALFECALLVVIFLYTPVFINVRLLSHALPSLGAAYSCMAASALFGQQACALLLSTSTAGAGADRRHAAALAAVSVSLASSLASVCLALALFDHTAGRPAAYNTLLVLFAMFHAAAGAYYAALPVLQRFAMSSVGDRPACSALGRCARCSLCAGALLAAGGRTHWLFVAAAALLAMALASSLALAAVALARSRRRPPAQDYVVLRQMDQAAEDSDADDVFA